RLRSDQTNPREDAPPSRLPTARMTTSCYCWSWRSLHRRTNAGFVGGQLPETTPSSISNHSPDGTNQIHPVLLRGAVKLVGSRPTCGQGGGNAWRFPRLVHRGPRWGGQAGIGAADCPQIHGTSSAWRPAASAGAGVNWPRYASSGVRQPSA